MPLDPDCVRVHELYKLAGRPPLESEFVEVILAPSSLQAGTNVLAVEMHQGAVDSSDLSFNLELTARVAQPEPRLETALAGSILTVRWPVLAGAYRLEQCQDLRPPVAWRPFTNVVDLDGTWSRAVITNAPIGQRFFRLVTP